MAVFRLTKDSIVKLPDTSFAHRGVKERTDLQRLLRNNIGVVADDVLIIAEEFDYWEVSKRRIDLLAVDHDANLIVIELKRDDEGGHMDLQAIRYAAMVSSMTFAQAVEVYQAFLGKTAVGQSAKNKLLEFLKWNEPSEEKFAGKVQIILVAADFSKELTTSVLWLNEQGLDMRCVRLKPYDNGSETIVDAQQVIPLPEAEDYIERVKAKDQAARAEGSDRHVLRRAFWIEFLPQAATATPRFEGKTPVDAYYITASAGPSGLRYTYLVWLDVAGVEFYINRDDVTFNKAIFDYLHSKKEEIERVYGKSIGWERLDSKRASRLFDDSVPGGIHSPRDQWPATQRDMMDAMIRLEKALAPHLNAAVEHASARTDGTEEK
ncbi:MAG: DUF4268 domain-containing protein [Planctomycetes bacterium]|nr:DUF4268 domain-containing protein [Planctomycetota bacterium]